MQYKAGTKYEWQPDAKIEISGKDFEILYNNLTAWAGSTFSPISTMRGMDAFALSQKILIDMVSNGIATPKQEVVEETK